jgi:chromosomal replication initiator protein
MSDLQIDFSSDTWTKYLSVLKAQLKPSAFEYLNAAISYGSYENDLLIVDFVNEYAKNFLGKKNELVLNQAAKSIYGQAVKLEFGVQKIEPVLRKTKEFEEEVSQPIARINKPKPVAKGQLDGFNQNKPLNPNYRLKNYVVGASNELAFQSITRVAESPGTTVYNPLVLHGCTGTGKTHLLQGLVFQLLETHPNLNILVRTGQELLEELISSLTSRAQFAFQKKLRSIDVLLIDDIQFVATRTKSGRASKSQEERAGIVAYLTAQGKQVVLVSDVEPSSIPFLSKTMISRCDSGVKIGIEIPEQELRTRILEQLAKTLYPNEVIPIEVMKYMGESFPRNVRDLTGLLTKLIAYCTFSREHITVEVARRVLGDVQKPENQVTLEQVLSLVQNEFDISNEKLLSKSKIRVASLPRKVAIYLLRKNTSMTLHTIGTCFNRDYSTIIFSLKAMTRLLEKNDELSERVAKLNDLLNR